MSDTSPARKPSTPPRWQADILAACEAEVERRCARRDTAAVEVLREAARDTEAERDEAAAAHERAKQARAAARERLEGRRRALRELQEQAVALGREVGEYERQAGKLEAACEAAYQHHESAAVRARLFRAALAEADTSAESDGVGEGEASPLAAGAASASEQARPEPTMAAETVDDTATEHAALSERPARAAQTRRERTVVPADILGNRRKRARWLLTRPGVNLLVDGYSYAEGLARSNSNGYTTDRSSRSSAEFRKLRNETDAAMTRLFKTYPQMFCWLVWDNHKQPAPVGQIEQREYGVMIFTQPGQSADDDIVERCEMIDPKCPVVVVTDDKGLHQRAKTYGASQVWTRTLRGLV